MQNILKQKEGNQSILWYGIVGPAASRGADAHVVYNCVMYSANTLAWKIGSHSLLIHPARSILFV